ncbi:alpha-mannosidase 2 [Zeugodacus cucurbitae]|uniref:alpha-mannosidase 2 n=1 Tax=Zeugodacus cucurbitae TaxID=28588 RepID=UPI000596A14D|nr:alpha-mannosidase 2 [Zeugodacus cucurbitae]
MLVPRRRLTLILCIICLSLLLVVYILINFVALTGENEPYYGALQSKLQSLEDGLHRHGQEMKHLKNRLDHQWQQKAELRQEQTQQQRQQEHDFLEKPVLAELDQCSFDFQQVPQPDVQMLDMYNEWSFADVDGGVWKQGWNIKYDPIRFNEHNKLKVFIVPHSHNDPGWVKTFEDYYEHDTKHILSNALRHLRENPDMTFIWAEISYFSRFYEDLGQHNKLEMKKLVQNRQLEFVSGGWVMPDEANSHWLSILMQLTEGQTWLKQNLNVTPTSSWSIDPFGHSPTLPYILKKSGFQNHLIQRTHYSVKKELALKRQLEFHWRQIWDTTGSTGLFTHMMPFYSYDIPHTCGPDPKICCQFDFKRMHQFGLSCPWHVPPQPITEQNVAQRAELIVDQWKKKAELYRTNALLIPLGDDFRFSQSTEWDVQRVNYEALFDHINSEHRHFVEAKFGTLQQYFDAVHQEQKEMKREFPTLSGDFFTYADRSDNYWSGYYTSRPYYKRLDRVLLHYVRAAEMLYAWRSWDPAAKFEEKLQNARRELSLFQHHDGITGTAKTHVVNDYAHRMLSAVTACQFVMQQSVYRLLTKASIYIPDYNFHYFYLDDSRWPGPSDSRSTIILGDELPTKHIVLHNSLARWREELVDFYVSSPYMGVRDSQDKPVEAQITPVWTWHRHTPSNSITPQASTTKYRLLFKAKVPPLGLATYTIQAQSSANKYTSYATNLILTTNPTSISIGNYPHEVKFGEHRPISLHVAGGPTVAFSGDGLLKSIQIDAHAPHTPIKLKFYKYSGDRSGAYLFMPHGPATPLVDMAPPTVLVSEGPLEASVSVGLPFVVHQTVLRGGAPEIQNLVDIGRMDDTEIAMRLSTRIENGDIFYTDLNGLQLIKRRRLSKLPLQANYYPIPSTAYIEDSTLRLTLLTGQPLGGSSLSSGELEIMQDRRLTHDDERGLGQGVLDNQPVLHIFRVVLEHIETCLKLSETHPSGALTPNAYLAAQTLLHPLDKFIFIENNWLGVLPSFGEARSGVSEDTSIAVMRNLPPTITKIPVARDRTPKEPLLNTGVVLHRTLLLQCRAADQQTGIVNLRKLLTMATITGVYNTSLTFLQPPQRLDTAEVTNLCPLDTQAYIVQHLG